MIGKLQNHYGGPMTSQYYPLEQNGKHKIYDSRRLRKPQALIDYPMVIYIGGQGFGLIGDFGVDLV